MESGSIAITQLHSSTSDAPETDTNEYDSLLPCEITATASSSSDTLSVDTDNISITASQQSLTADYSESVINEIRTQILDDVLKEFNESDQLDSAVPFVDECRVKESNTLDDIDQYIRREQNEQDTAKFPVVAMKIIDAPPPVLETREPISTGFNESQIVSVKYTESGNEILTLDVPVSHEISSTTLFELDTSLPLSQFTSDVGEEGDYLLPPSQSGASTKFDGTISTISFGSSILGTTDEYSAGGELDSSSSFYAAAVLSDSNVNVDSTPVPAANEDVFDEPGLEKNGKRKLSIADDYETEFLLSKSRKPEVQSTPFSST